MSTCPPLILELVERFTLNKDRYLSPNYNEEQLRHEFLNPMFEILGWDMTNKKGFSDAYKEVLYEESIKAGAPDYSFRIGGNRKFFVEAKAPHVNIVMDSRSAGQLRSYAWSAKLALSILTDFANFAVYDGRIPLRSELPASGEARVLLIPYTEYPTRWAEIESIFSQDAIGKGLFDRFAESKTDKRGTAPVDEEFLGQISHWRDRLASSLRESNPNLTAPELNFAVQMIIDRIVFLRIAEDRGLESYGQLQTIAKVHNIYGELLHLFQSADTRYNSGLFHFRAEADRSSLPDDLTPSLTVSDSVLQDIITGLYPPRSHYRFSHVPSEILGQVYEQFLGKVIVLTPKRAKVEEKPEIRKAGGVYYTPSYIVNYIVDNTLGRLLQDRTPPDAAKLKILDPACGSGSFLLGAYQKLLDWHLDFYYHHDPEKLARQKNPPIRQIAAPPSSGLFESKPSYHLTIAERKRILTNNIFGVDIDAQAVEVTKLSLLLKCLEDETAESVQSLLKFMRQRALPDLDDNIKCGNSLIAPDFYDPARFPENQSLSDDDKRRINAFDWRLAFPAITRAGGFDAVIGNPPYVRIQGFPENQVVYLTRSYEAATGNCDLYVSFAERGFHLLRKSGTLGFILPNKFFKTDYGEGLRRLLSSANAVDRVVDFGASQVFDATTYTCLLFLQKDRGVSFSYTQTEASAVSLTNAAFSICDNRTLGPTAWTFESPATASLMATLARQTIRLLDLPASMSRGSSTGDDEVFLLPTDRIEVEPAILRDPLFATDFGRYRFSLKGKWKAIFPYLRENGSCRLYSEKELKARFPRAFAYLQKNQTALNRRKQFTQWFGYSAPRNLELHDAAHIVVPLLADRGIFTLIPEKLKGKLCPMASGGFTITLGEQCKMAPQYVLGLLNSKLLFWRLRSMSNLFRGGWITCTKQYFGELPIHIIDQSNRSEKIHHDRIVQLVDRIIDLNKKLPAARLPSDKTRLQREIAATDSQIDTLVYDLYKLTPDEIKLVEEATTCNSISPAANDKPAT